MNLSRDKLLEFMQKHENGNYNKFARELQVDPSHLYKFINTGVGGGKRIVLSVIKYCKDRGLDYSDLIEM